ncbi:MAG: RidA family protein [Lacipirellulaceae bacterium]
MSHEARISALNLTLPPAPKAIGLYKPVVECQGLLYTSGHGPLQPDGTLTCGRAGDDIDLESAKAAARQTGLAMLASLREYCGSLDRIARLVKTVGLVQTAADFKDQPAVINGFSELMRDVFGEEQGVAARSAFGAASLPGGWVVDIEAVFELA